MMPLNLSSPGSILRVILYIWVLMILYLLDPYLPEFLVWNLRKLKRCLSLQSTSELPPEVIQYIFSFVDPKDTKTMRSLVLLSKWFQADSEKRLYHTLKFHKPHQITLLRTLATCPTLANHVKSFIFHEPPYLLWKPLESAFSAMINLEYLELGPPQSDEVFFTREFTLKAPMALTYCKFPKLVEFRKHRLINDTPENRWFWEGNNFLSFYANHPHLRRLSAVTCIHPRLTLKALNPELRYLEVDTSGPGGIFNYSLLDLLNNHNIEVLYTDSLFFDITRFPLDPSSHFLKSVRVLVIRESVAHPGLNFLDPHVLAFCTSLEVLRLPQCSSLAKLMDSLILLPSLKHLILNRICTDDTDDIDSADIIRLLFYALPPALTRIDVQTSNNLLHSYTRSSRHPISLPESQLMEQLWPGKPLRPSAPHVAQNITNPAWRALTRIPRWMQSAYSNWRKVSSELDLFLYNTTGQRTENVMAELVKEFQGMFRHQVYANAGVPV